MDENQLEKALSSLPLGGLRYFDSIGSTNDVALAWASQGALDLSLTIAEEQTAGKGRSKRKWITKPGSALAFSLILHPSPAELAYPARITGLGALALAESLRKMGLKPEIKWPNDVLINGRKTAGILVETVWSGEILKAVVLGIGVNVLNASIPPADEMLFPPTSIEQELGQSLDRIELLKDIISAVIKWRKVLGEDEFIRTWEEALAYRGEQIQVLRDQQKTLTGEVIGLNLEGRLVIQAPDGNLQDIEFGELHLRPAI